MANAEYLSKKKIRNMTEKELIENKQLIQHELDTREDEWEGLASLFD